MSVATDQILSAKVGTNADVFPSILSIFVPQDSAILDMTYGKGVFWSNVDRTKYQLTTNDSVTEADCHEDFRHTSWADQSLDVVVLDPPYMHASGTIKPTISGCYQNNDSTELKNQKAVRQLYFDGATEARRILRKDGILILKCQDMIESAKPNWNHCVFMNLEGFICEDLFVVVQKSIPIYSPRWTKQYHARKNHSYFLVLRKKA